MITTASTTRLQVSQVRCPGASKYEYIEEGFEVYYTITVILSLERWYNVEGTQDRVLGICSGGFGGEDPSEPHTPYSRNIPFQA